MACEQYGQLCTFCKRGLPHPVPPDQNKKRGEYFRRYHALDLMIGKNEQAKFEKHYANHGILVSHRDCGNGQVEPVITSGKQLERMVESRGFNNLRK